MTEDELVGWYHRLRGCEFEQTPRNSAGQGSSGTLQSMKSKSWTQLSDQTTTNIYSMCNIYISENLCIFA